MQCLKCGKETKESQVFCETCLASMEQYPVKPGTAVHLPHANTESAAKKQTIRRRIPTPEEQVVQLKKLIRWMAIALGVLCVMLGLTAGMLIHNILQEPDTNTVGRNYTTMDSTAP